jgi:hypothetical protein
MPPPFLEKQKNAEGKQKRGRAKKTKELTLLERLRDVEEDANFFNSHCAYNFGVANE